MVLLTFDSVGLVVHMCLEQGEAPRGKLEGYVYCIVYYALLMFPLGAPLVNANMVH